MTFDYKETFWLDSETLREIDRLVKDGRHKSRAELIRAAIEKKVNEYNSKIDSNKIELELPQFHMRALEIIADYEGKSGEEIIIDAVSRYINKRPKELKKEKETMKMLKKMYGIK